MKRTHYQNLRVAENAPLEVIRAAWKALSQQHHPDKNPGDENASKIMQILNEAYEVLSDPIKRAAHDRAIERSRKKFQNEPFKEPSPSPKERFWFVYVGNVIGPLTLAQMAQLQRSGKISLQSPVSEDGLTGWMVLGDLLQQLNKQPVDRRTARPSSRQSQTLLQIYRIAAVLAVGVLVLAVIFVQGKTSQTGPTKTKASKPVVPAASSLDKMTWPSDSSSPVPAKPPISSPYTSAPHFTQNTSDKTPSRALSSKPKYSRALLTPYGHYWPTSSKYLPGAPMEATGGLCQLTVDNSQCTSDVHVKVKTFGIQTVRECFIKAGERFHMEEFVPGHYEVHYRDLDSGIAAKSDALELYTRPTPDGVQYSVVSLTLYVVRGGNTSLTPLAEDDF